MKIIVCLDDHNGMMFNHRRQSQDRLLRADILRHCQEKKLYMNAYSHTLFQKDLLKQTPEKALLLTSTPSPASFIVSEDFLRQAGEKDFCFIENWTDFLTAAAEDASLFDQLEEVILYHWNRTYPADVYFTLDLAEENWERIKQEEFAGSSHEQITKEIYQRKKPVRSTV